MDRVSCLNVNLNCHQLDYSARGVRATVELRFATKRVNMTVCIFAHNTGLSGAKSE